LTVSSVQNKQWYVVKVRNPKSITYLAFVLDGFITDLMRRLVVSDLTVLVEHQNGNQA